MQTWLVHMRAPIRLLRELALGGFLTLQLVAALVHPLFLALFVLEFAALRRSPGQGLAEFLLSFLYSSVFFGGYLTSMVLGLVGLARRRLWSSAWVLLLVPVYWILLSIAACQAVWKLVHDPYRWDKTEHGLARTSRKIEQADKGSKPARSVPIPAISEYHRRPSRPPNRRHTARRAPAAGPETDRAVRPIEDTA